MRHIVVLGAGFGGLHAAKTIEKLIPGRRRVQLTLVNNQSHFLFTPLLPNVANGDIERHNITLPIKEHLDPTTDFVQTQINEIDLEQSILRGEGIDVPFDYLILAPGAVTNWQNNENIKRWSMTIKQMHDADMIRKTIDEAFDRAGQSFDEATKQRALTFVFAGGGATGVETAAELHSSIVERIYPQIGSDLRQKVRFVLVEAEDRLVPNMSAEIGHMAQTHLTHNHFDLQLGRRVIDRNAQQVILNDHTKIESANLFWCAGVQAPPWLQKTKGLNFDERGRVIVNEYLQVDGRVNVFAIGDVASTPNDSPQNVQTALLQAPLVAKNLVAILSGRTPQPWQDPPIKEVISLGQGNAAAKIGETAFEGKAAYALYRMTYMSMLPSTIKKLRLVRDWFGSDLDRRRIRTNYKQLEQ